MAPHPVMHGPYLDVAAVLEALDDNERLLPHVPTRESGRTHAEILAPYLERAAIELSHQRFMRCTCPEVSCQASQTVLRAWHLFWAHERAMDRRRFAFDLAEALGWYTRTQP